jgi:hypothetical protein
MNFSNNGHLCLETCPLQSPNVRRPHNPTVLKISKKPTDKLSKDFLLIFGNSAFINYCADLLTFGKKISQTNNRPNTTVAVSQHIQPPIYRVR